MYNKLFTKILDSSIWLETTPTRIVWLTLLATMDEDGFSQFAGVGNVASRARVTLEEAVAAIGVLEAPDPDSSDPSHEGRRVERVPGGWMVLNADKHRELVTRAISREKTRLRVQKHREAKRGNAAVTPANDGVRQSETYSVSESEVKTSVPATRSRFVKPTLEELKKHLIARGSSVDAEQFMAHYESQGWMVGKRPMVNWKAAVVTWEKNSFGGIPAPPPSTRATVKRSKVNPADPRAAALLRNLEDHLS